MPNRITIVQVCDATADAKRYSAGFIKKTAFVGLMLAFFVSAFSQKEPVKNWHLLDAEQDGYHGISLKKAMILLKDKTPKPILVAVLDGGVDTNHVALKNSLHNFHGWNFLGNSDGRNVNHDSQESVRLYHLWKNKFLNNFDSAQADAATLQDFKNWKNAKNEIEEKEKEGPNLMTVRMIIRASKMMDSILQTEMGQKEFTPEELTNFSPKTTVGRKAKLSFLRTVDLLELDKDKTNRQIFEEFDEMVTKESELVFGKKDTAVNYRQNIIGDDENTLASTHYGNADVTAATPLHGTHVSGIIAATCSDSGACGVAPFAKILAVRCIPDGDEHDKDVALGIFYAVDNGAKIINMSFGKNTSPHKAWVDSAIRYAAAHDVLIVHAAGNDSRSTDEQTDYPNNKMLDGSIAQNIITVGSSGDSSLACGMIADFTNYGLSVDVLAPGVRIFSTLPNNSFGYEQGTSMSAPIVSGMAAVLRSYFPKLTAVQTKLILEKSVDKSMSEQSFKKPGNGKKETAKLLQLCKTGGIVNLYHAVQEAIKMDAK